MNFFAYGSLVFPAVMEAVTGGAFPSEPATLRGFARFQLRARRYPGIAERAGESTAGRLYASLDARAFAFLDLFEDDFYERRELAVERSDGSVSGASCYVIPPRHAGLLLDAAWSETRFAEHDLPRYLTHCRTFHARARAHVDA